MREIEKANWELAHRFQATSDANILQGFGMDAVLSTCSSLLAIVDVGDSPNCPWLSRSYDTRTHHWHRQPTKIPLNGYALTTGVCHA
jgi:hypothetical protein